MNANWRQVSKRLGFIMAVCTIWGSMELVPAQAQCVTSPTGLVSWFRGENNAQDEVGPNNAATYSGIGFDVGKVGQAFQFNGQDALLSYASPSLNVGTGGGLTIELWIKPTTLQEQPLVEWNNGTNYGAHLWMFGPPGRLYVNLVDTAGTWHNLVSANGLVIAGQWQHIALTYDKNSGTTNLYRNGVQVATQNLGSFTPQTSYNLWFGRRASENLFYNGGLDEISLYNRALSATDVQAIYNAGAGGKCLPSKLLVTNTSDNLPGSLRYVINSAHEYDIINFDIPTSDPGYNSAINSFTIQLTSGELLINKPLTIGGPGNHQVIVRRSTAAGTPDFRIFEIGTGIRAEFYSLTISGGKAYSTNYSDDVGGGILNKGTLTLFQVEVSGNSARYEGGGIHNTDTIDLTLCTISDNSADYGGGLMCYSISGKGSIKYSAISGNRASSTGGIFSSSALDITATTISDNTGGGMRSDGTLNFTDSTISGNDGGGVSAGLVNIGTATLVNSTISNNSGDYCAGIYDNGALTLRNCTITANSAPAGWGSGLRIDSRANPSVQIGSSIIAGNANDDVNFTDGSTNPIVSNGYNLIGSGTAVNTFTAAGDSTGATTAQLKLGPLQNNGGATFTHALLPGSPAIDKGKRFSTDPNHDQRGAVRLFDDVSIANAPGGDGSDIGAFELDFAAPSVSVNNPRSLPEGSAAAPGSITFDIALSAACTKPVTVNYQTLDGINNPATAGSDYVVKAGKLTFAPGETLKRVTIKFIGDSVLELNETFFVDLKTPTNATLDDSRGVGQINNDDGPSLTIANAAAVNEGNSGTKPQTFTVTLSAPATHAVTVDWTTANGTANTADYVAASGTLSFAPGETSKLITVQVKGDTLVEPNETYKVTLSKVTYAFIADGQGIGTIRNDDATPQVFQDEPSQ